MVQLRDLNINVEIQNWRTRNSELNDTTPLKITQFIEFTQNYGHEWLFLEISIQWTLWIQLFSFSHSFAEDLVQNYDWFQQIYKIYLMGPSWTLLLMSH